MKFRKWIAAALAVCMILPTAAMAVDVDEVENVILLGSGYIENPDDAYDTIEPAVISNTEVVEFTLPDVYYNNKEEAASELLTRLKKRESEINIGVTKELFWAMGGSSAWSTLFETARTHNKNDPTGGDYTGHAWKSMQYAYGEGATTGNYILQFNIIYRTTRAQEDEMDEKVAELVAQWEVQDLGEYDTIKTIYDYITANVTYDYDGLYDETDKIKYTPYGALCEGSAVCMGIALLFYRLALEMDVDTRYILSTDSEGHAWDIVQLEDYYYNVDATWDLDQYNSNDHWFLKNMEDFQINWDGSACHTRRDSFLTEDFMEAYPMAETSYVVLVDPIEGTWEDLEWVYDGNTKTLTICGEGAIPTTTTDETYPWDEYRSDILRVVLEEGITEIPYSMFAGYSNMETCSLPATVSQIVFDQTYCYTYNLQSITVDENNSNYTSVDGVLYNKDMTVLYVYPDASPMTTFDVPDTVKEMTFTMLTMAKNLQKVHIPASVEKIWYISIISRCKMGEIDVAEDNPNYCSVDGVLYNKDMTVLYQYPGMKTDTVFTVPDTVEFMGWSSLMYAPKLTTLYMGKNVKNVGGRLLGSTSNITSIYFPGDLPTYFTNAFSNMADKITFYYPTGASGWTSPTMELDGVTYKTASYTRYIASDLTGDGVIDADDLSLLQDYFSGKDVTFDLTKADFNGDGKFTRADVMYLARALANWDGYKLN